MIKLTSPITVFFLAAMVALGPLATSMYLPAFPAMGETLGVDADMIQLTLSAYMIGLAVAQLVCGPLADRFGRKPLLLSGIALFCLGSVGCMLAESINNLLLFRFLQAFGAAAGMVLSQAMVRDIFEPIDAARKLAYMGSTIALAPAVAPVVGGILLVQFGWPSIFFALALYAALTWVVVSIGLPESLPVARRLSLNPRSVLANYLAVIRNRMFLAHALAVSFMFAGHYGFMSGASFVLIELFEIPEAHFGWYFMFVVAAFISGNLLGARIASRVGPHRLILGGTSILTLGGALMVTFVLGEVDSVLAIIGPQVIYGMGSGIIMPLLIAGALTPFQHMAGTAASLLGFIQMGAAALSSALVGQLYDGTALPMASILAFSGTAALCSYLLLQGGKSRAAYSAASQE